MPTTQARPRPRHRDCRERRERGLMRPARKARIDRDRHQARGMLREGEPPTASARARRGAAAIASTARVARRRSADSSELTAARPFGASARRAGAGRRDGPVATVGHGGATTCAARVQACPPRARARPDRRPRLGPNRPPDDEAEVHDRDLQHHQHEDGFPDHPAGVYRQPPQGCSKSAANTGAAPLHDPHSKAARVVAFPAPRRRICR